MRQRLSALAFFRASSHTLHSLVNTQSIFNVQPVDELNFLCAVPISPWMMPLSLHLIVHSLNVPILRGPAVCGETCSRLISNRLYATLLDWLNKVCTWLVEQNWIGSEPADDAQLTVYLSNWRNYREKPQPEGHYLLEYPTSPTEQKQLRRDEEKIKPTKFSHEQLLSRESCPIPLSYTVPVPLSLPSSTNTKAEGTILLK